MSAPVFVDELPSGFGWINSRPGFLRRASHALAVGGRVWLFDPTIVDGLDERVHHLMAHWPDVKLHWYGKGQRPGRK